MTSHGQRFRRRALRRGYKVDEVDSFLDRVEATIEGEPLDAPVGAQEVHDVVFRVRFGGYDEWQVDLHLDRVERQLADSESQAAPPSYARAPEGRLGAPPAERPGPPEHPVPGFPPPMGPPPGHRPAPAPAPGYHEPPEPEYDQYDEPTYGGFDPQGAGRRGGHEQLSDATSEMRFGPPPGGPQGPPGQGPPGPPPGPGPRGPGGPPRLAGGMAGPAMAPPPPMSPHHPGPPHGGGPPPPHSGGPPPPHSGGPPPPHSGGPPPPHSGGPAGPPDGPASADLRRLDELRRGFQPRRFGSGYDREQVDRLFEQAMAGVAGHGPMSVSPDQIDPRRFDLVPGGYFEGDVDSAMGELREILRRH